MIVGFVGGVVSVGILLFLYRHFCNSNSKNYNQLEMNSAHGNQFQNGDGNSQHNIEMSKLNASDRSSSSSNKKQKKKKSILGPFRRNSFLERSSHSKEKRSLLNGGDSYTPSPEDLDIENAPESSTDTGDDTISVIHLNNHFDTAPSSNR